MISCIQLTVLFNCEDHLHYCQMVFKFFFFFLIKTFSLVRWFFFLLFSGIFFYEKEQQNATFHRVTRFFFFYRLEFFREHACQVWRVLVINFITNQNSEEKKNPTRNNSKIRRNLKNLTQWMSRNPITNSLNIFVTVHNCVEN